MTAKDIQTNYNYMSNAQNDIIKENIQEMIEEENQNRLNLEEAVLDEMDTEESLRLTAAEKLETIEKETFAEQMENPYDLKNNTIEQAVLAEDDEAKVKQHAIDQGAFPDENI